MSNMESQGDTPLYADRFRETGRQVYAIDAAEDASAASRAVNEILRQALDCGASDIHLEPREGGLVVRLRCDGLLRETRRYGEELRQQLINRIKVMAELDVTEKRLPQDGHLALRWQGRRYDLRVSTLPLLQGEKLALRVLGQREQLLSLEELAFSSENLARVRELLQLPNGLVIVCGPTGSGKTTTLYSMLQALRARGGNIVTLEDPVEYEMPGVNQVQINERTGLTFARGLRSILRQDPDIIMVGEIRDLESAEIALRLAYTGHLVLASLHTGTALGAIERLVEMGVASYWLAGSLNGVVAQRLVRRRGGAGRLAIQEVLRVDSAVRRSLTCYEDFLRREEQIAAGYSSLAEDGRRKAALGLTSEENVAAVLGPDFCGARGGEADET